MWPICKYPTVSLEGLKKSTINLTISQCLPRSGMGELPNTSQMALGCCSGLVVTVLDLEVLQQQGMS